MCACVCVCVYVVSCMARPILCLRFRCFGVCVAIVVFVCMCWFDQACSVFVILFYWCSLTFVCVYVCLFYVNYFVCDPISMVFVPVSFSFMSPFVPVMLFASMLVCVLLCCCCCCCCIWLV